jgi:polyisoprenoid-binding protein YceI
VTAQLLQAGVWTVSDSRTRVTFTVANLGRPVHGSVSCAWGELRLDAEGRPVSVRAGLDLASVDTGIARRDRDLRARHFLDTDRHPVMTWTATRFTPRDDGSWTAGGVLALRGTSAPLTLVGTPEQDDAGLRVRARGELDRTAVGIRAPSLLVGRTVRVEVDARLVPRRP